MVLMEEGISTSSNDVQSQNAPSPIDVTDVGIVISLNDVHRRKEYLPIIVTDVGIIIDFIIMKLLLMMEELFILDLLIDKKYFYLYL